MLVRPGVEIHSFEPTPQNIIDIKNSDFFIYTGGESDSWVESILDSLDLERTKVIKLMDLVELKAENTLSAEDDLLRPDDEILVEYDEHVWTSIKNAITIIESLKNEFLAKNPGETSYQKNADIYLDELRSIDAKIESLVGEASRKVLIFGDRFPLRYFVEDYGLEYYAAFPGCSEQSEADASTIAFLIEKVESENIPVVFHIELSSSAIAEEIARPTGAKVLEFHTAHNISKNDFDTGRTYADIMRDNYDALKEALK